MPQESKLFELCLDSWAGRTNVPCEIVGETPKKYRIKLLKDSLLPSKKYGKAGEIVLVPKYAVREKKF